jgi:uncharacterized protein (TIGR00369 family)
VTEHFRKLERMYHAAPTNAYFRPVLTVSDGAAEIRIPVREEFFHAARAVHGSVYFKALDDAAFFAASSVVTDFFVLTVSFTIHLLRPVTSGTLLAKGRLVHRSRQLLLADAELFDDAARVIARGPGPFMRSTIALTGELGYE